MSCRKTRWNGCVLRGNDWLQPHIRRAVRMDAPEAHTRLPFRTSQTGVSGKSFRARAAHRSVHERGLRLGQDTVGSYEDVEKPTPPGKYGGGGLHAPHPPSHPFLTQLPPRPLPPPPS